MPTTTTDLATGTWGVDPVHSQVEFTARHLGLTKADDRPVPVRIPSPRSR